MATRVKQLTLFPHGQRFATTTFYHLPRGKESHGLFTRRPAAICWSHTHCVFELCKCKDWLRQKGPLHAVRGQEPPMRSSLRKTIIKSGYSCGASKCGSSRVSNTAATHDQPCVCRGKPASSEIREDWRFPLRNRSRCSWRFSQRFPADNFATSHSAAYEFSSC